MTRARPLVISLTSTSSWRTASGETVEQTTSRISLSTPASRPFSPAKTALTWGMSGTMKKTMSDLLASSFADPAQTAPPSSRSLMRSELMSFSTRVSPAGRFSNIWRAMG